MITAVPFFEGKKKYLEYLKSKEGFISWTALFTGPFFDWVSVEILLSGQFVRFGVLNLVY